MDSHAVPLSPEGLPAALAHTVLKARRSWLTNAEIWELLRSVDTTPALALSVSSEGPHKPPGGSLFLFNKRACRYFRKDGHPWETKADGKTVNETHEKLRVGHVKALNCYYARSGEDDLKRRSYWRLDVGVGETLYALVHYLNAEGKMDGGPLRSYRPRVELEYGGGDESEDGYGRPPPARRARISGRGLQQYRGHMDEGEAAESYQLDHPSQRAQQQQQSQGQHLSLLSGLDPEQLGQLGSWLQQRHALQQAPACAAAHNPDASHSSSFWGSAPQDDRLAAAAAPLAQQDSAPAPSASQQPALALALSLLSCLSGSGSQLPASSQLPLLAQLAGSQDAAQQAHQAQQAPQAPQAQEQQSSQDSSQLSLTRQLFSILQSETREALQQTTQAQQGLEMMLGAAQQAPVQLPLAGPGQASQCAQDLGQSQAQLERVHSGGLHGPQQLDQEPSQVLTSLSLLAQHQRGLAQQQLEAAAQHRMLAEVYAAHLQHV